MIITALKGGLGNQMFAYAAGLALAEQHRTILKLDASWYRVYEDYEPHNRYALSCFNITEQIATREEIHRLKGQTLSVTERWSVEIAKRLHLFKYVDAITGQPRHQRQQGFRFCPGFLDLPDDSYIDGSWQSELFFEPVQDLLRLHFSFRYPAQPKVTEMARQIQNGGPSAFMHFRRGDYVTNPSFAKEIGCVEFDYYKKALDRLRERCPELTLYLFSDDMDFVEREFKPDLPHVYVRATEPWHSYDKIRLMSLCDHGIISNSTFAWWGAWLNPNPNKIIIAPDPWFSSSSSSDSSDVVPKSWLRLSVNR